MLEKAGSVDRRGEDRFEETVIWIVERAVVHGERAWPSPTHR